MNWWPSGLGLLGATALTLSLLNPAIAAQSPEESDTDPQFIREAIACPTDLEDLTAMLLRDLPSYANRVNQRWYELDDHGAQPGYVLLASQPEFEPLTLGPGSYAPSESAKDDDIRQVFFTTLERQYVADGAVSLQYHHWLFLTYADQRWWVVTLMSQLADFPDGQILAPPEDTGQGVVAQAVRLWLRDCQNRAVEPLSALPPFELGAAMRDSANSRR
ncbi:MAG: hypothetical protein IGR76_07295 [Synechococcales cyanobacterium T60_A2020_003]|nr:hypothetical protein [Synechococcales cyanobacterium T60_A2020_003]